MDKAVERIYIGKVDHFSITEGLPEKQGIKKKPPNRKFFSRCLLALAKFFLGLVRKK